MGQNVLRNLGAMTSLHNQKVEQARFVVLKSPDTPSILVETGFISNPVEEQRLASSQYQEQLSQAIYNGIYQYFKEYPPRGAVVQ
jgi:N-acetylmuramoyl-L-alanine amidase